MVNQVNRLDGRWSMKISHSASPRNRSSLSSRSPMTGSVMAGAATRGFAPTDLASAVPAIVDPVTWSAMVIGARNPYANCDIGGVYRPGRRLAKRPDHIGVYFPSNSGGTMSRKPPPAFGSRPGFRYDGNYV